MKTIHFQGKEIIGAGVFDKSKSPLLASFCKQNFQNSSPLQPLSFQFPTKLNSENVRSHALQSANVDYLGRKEGRV